MFIIDGECGIYEKVKTKDDNIKYKHIAVLHKGFIGKLIDINKMKEKLQKTKTKTKKNTNDTNTTNTNYGANKLGNSKKLLNYIEKIEENDMDTVDDESKCWNFTIIANKDMKLLVWDQSIINKYLLSNARLIQSSIFAMNNDLNNKLTLQSDFVRINNYKEIISIAITNTPIRNKMYNKIEEYRNNHNITEFEHEKVLHEFGWTSQQFKNGTKSFKFLDQIKQIYDDHTIPNFPSPNPTPNTNKS